MSSLPIPSAPGNKPLPTYLIRPPVEGLDRIEREGARWIWIEILRFKSSVRGWHNRGCPALGLERRRGNARPTWKRLDLKQFSIPGHVGHDRAFVREADAKVIERWRTEPDSKMSNVEQASEMGFGRAFLLKYSELWHPPGGKPHPMLERWIGCGMGPQKEKRFVTADLEELKRNFDVLHQHKATAAADANTIDAIELAKLARVDRAVIYHWEENCPYLPETDDKLPIAGSRLVPTKNGAVEPVKTYPRREGEEAAKRFREAKAGVFVMTDPAGERVEYLSWRKACRRGGRKGKPLTGWQLKELVTAGIVHRQQAPGWGYRSKHGPKPWVFHSGHLDTYRKNGRTKQVDPQTHEPIRPGEKERRHRELQRAKLQPHWIDGRDWYETDGAVRVAGCTRSQLNNWTRDPHGVVHHQCPYLDHDPACRRVPLSNRTPSVRRVWLGDDLRIIYANKHHRDLPPAPLPPAGVASERIIARINSHTSKQHARTQRKLGAKIGKSTAEAETLRDQLSKSKGHEQGNQAGDQLPTVPTNWPDVAAVYGWTPKTAKKHLGHAQMPTPTLGRKTLVLDVLKVDPALRPTLMRFVPKKIAEQSGR